MMMMIVFSITANKSFQSQLLFVGMIILILSITSFSIASETATLSLRCTEREQQALLNFKKGLIDPHNLLSSWTIEEEDCCSWIGVGCDNLTRFVVRLQLQSPLLTTKSSTYLRGEISSSLLELPYLTFLDLSWNEFDTIPNFIGSLTNLTYLDLSWNHFNGKFPYQVGNLSKLQYLDLRNNGDISSDNIEWFDHLSSLRVLRLSNVKFGNSVDWLKSFKMHSSLSSLDFSFCHFPDANPLSISHVDSSNTLASLHLYNVSFNSSIDSWLVNVSIALVDLEIAYTDQLKGPISEIFGDMPSLVRLSLYGNQLEGSIPASFRNLCHLKTFDLADNNLGGPLSRSMENLRCSKECLEIVWLDRNKFNGSIQVTTQFLSLRKLGLSHNYLDGPLPNNIWKFSNLEFLYISSNKLNGVISESQLSNLSKLQVLALSDNFLSLSFSSSWAPSFQLDTIKLSSCNLGPQFPSWLQTQYNYSRLDISNAQISDAIPIWFWKLPSRLVYLNISSNHIYGKVPQLLSLELYSFPAVDLSNNSFNGPIPQFLFNTTVLNLSKNKFSGQLSFVCTFMHNALNYINLSNNLLFGPLPDCWAPQKLLITLNLEHNNLSGTIPPSFEYLSQIRTLRLRNNSFEGELPLSLKYCSLLEVIDVGENKLIGKIPAWIGESLKNLVVLQLRSNDFHGEIPVTICQLEHVQIIDFSFNNLTGTIPYCLDNLTAITHNQSFRGAIFHPFYYSYVFWNRSSWILASGPNYYADYVSVIWKGNEQEYRKTLGLLKLVDLSSNKLNGEIPEQVTSLLGIISLNLSRNNLTGAIPERIGQLKALESLDLSYNQLSGEIPKGVADITFLGMLDLSNNQLRGRIPTGSQLQGFDASAYANNSGLCGPPLPKGPCEGTVEEPPSTDGIESNMEEEEEEEWFERSWLYAGAGVGFFVGFWGLFVYLMINQYFEVPE